MNPVTTIYHRQGKTFISFNVVFIEAEERLQQLNKEKQVLDQQLKVAHDKVKMSEDQKAILEARLLQVVPIREGDRIRRAHSFMPSTKERPVMLEVRAATLKRPFKQ